MNYRGILRERLILDEGDRRFPYRDTVGKITIGIGRNLSDVGIRADERDLMYMNDVKDAEAVARLLVPNFDSLSDVRKMVVVNMAFNMGGDTLATFKNTLLAIRQGRWADAANGMAKSKWAAQVGDRAKRLIYNMRSDKL